MLFKKYKTLPNKILIVLISLCNIRYVMKNSGKLHQNPGKTPKSVYIGLWLFQFELRWGVYCARRWGDERVTEIYVCTTSLCISNIARKSKRRQKYSILECLIDSNDQNVWSIGMIYEFENTLSMIDSNYLSFEDSKMYDIRKVKKDNNNL